MGSPTDDIMASLDNSSIPFVELSTAPPPSIEDETIDLNTNDVPNDENDETQIGVRRKLRNRRAECLQHYNIVEDKDAGTEIGSLTEMMETFKKYWNEFVMVLAFAVIFDPRFKLAFVKTQGKEEGENMTKEVYNQLNGLFKEYQNAAGVSDPIPSSAQKLKSDSQTKYHYDKLEEFELFDPCDSSKSELDRFLDELRLSRGEDLCVLNYWKKTPHVFQYFLLWRGIYWLFP